ncbi:cobalamin biosynthesis protein CobD [Candidatus Uhrbacteria bacterium]|nr:cobalamin biosynthesis protein CobD [Candidatus Uhrbacteria bacterium]
MPFGDIHSAIIGWAVIMDLAIGDPKWLFHPVRAIGWFAARTEEPLRRAFPSRLKVAGAVQTAAVVSATAGLAAALGALSWEAGPVFGLVFHAAGLASALSIRSLAAEGRAVRRLLDRGLEGEARIRAGTIVSRDMSKEGRKGIIRATVESLTENLSDGVVAPLFYAAIGGLPGVWAYKAVNTLDSMVGYRNVRYRDFGWAAARLDDLANIIPARLTGILQVTAAAVVGDDWRQGIRSWIRDAQKGPSPNGGIPICVFAGAAGIALGGDCRGADGEIVHIPEVGGKRRGLRTGDIGRSILYHYLVSILAAVLAAVVPTVWR